MNEKLNSADEVSFDSLPESVRRQIMRIHNSYEVKIGDIYVKSPEEIYYLGRQVVDMTNVDTMASASPTEPVARPVKAKRPAPEVVHRVEPVPTDETIAWNQIPAEAQGYIDNYLHKLTMAMNVGGKMLVIGEEFATYGNKRVVKETVPAESISFGNLPEWAQEKIRQVAAVRSVTVEMRDGGRLVVDASHGRVTATYNKITVINIPQ